LLGDAGGEDRSRGARRVCTAAGTISPCTLVIVSSPVGPRTAQTARLQWALCRTWSRPHPQYQEDHDQQYRRQEAEPEPWNQRQHDPAGTTDHPRELQHRLRAREDRRTDGFRHIALDHRVERQLPE